jgi:hypothetical protein
MGALKASTTLESRKAAHTTTFDANLKRFTAEVNLRALMVAFLALM